jgi:hypothetical protein
MPRSASVSVEQTRPDRTRPNATAARDRSTAAGRPPDRAARNTLPRPSIGRTTLPGPRCPTPPHRRTHRGARQPGRRRATSGGRSNRLVLWHLRASIGATRRAGRGHCSGETRRCQPNGADDIGFSSFMKRGELGRHRVPSERRRPAADGGTGHRRCTTAPRPLTGRAAEQGGRVSQPSESLGGIDPWSPRVVALLRRSAGAAGCW